MIAHTLGNTFAVREVSEFCKKHKLWLVEDCCDAAYGALCTKAKKVGTYGDVATVSFYPAHHITMGEAEPVLSTNPVLKRAAERSAIGAVTVGVLLEKTTPVRSVTTGLWVHCPKATITNIRTRMSATI